MFHGKLFPSGKSEKQYTVCINEGVSTFVNGTVVLESGVVTCNLKLYESAVDSLQRLIESSYKARVKRALYIDLFGKVRQLYPAVATGGLVFNDRSPFCYYDEDSHLVSMQTTKPVCVLLHELGHAYAHMYYPPDVGDEALAWDTAKSLAVEIGYSWTEEDDRTVVECLSSYGITL